MQKINVYADETGQDTQGRFFLVAVVIVPTDAVQHFEYCELVSEKEGGRSARKWRSSNKKSRTAYLGCLLKQDLRGLRVRIQSYRNRTDYTAMTAETIAHSIRVCSRGLNVSPFMGLTFSLDGYPLTESLNNDTLQGHFYTGVDKRRGDRESPAHAQGRVYPIQKDPRPAG
jgi:hypothetical protein